MRELRISIASTFIVLICIGVVMIYSATSIYALQIQKDSTYYLFRHLLFLSMGFVGMLMAMTVDYRQLQKLAKPMLILGVFLLVAVLVPGIGRESNGARRWFHLGAFNFQPSEYVKVVMLIYMADFLARKKTKIAEFKDGFIPAMLVMREKSLPSSTSSVEPCQPLILPSLL